MSEREKETESLEEGLVDHLESEAPSPSLLLLRPGGKHVVLPLLEGVPVVVGRAEPSDIVVQDSGLSRQHARFELQDDGVWVEDLGSTNGTRVFGRLVGGRTRVTLGEVVRLGAVAVAVTHAPRTADQASPPDGAELIGASSQLERLRGLIRRVAPSTVSVLILGETGTGKELVARAIHDCSDRAAAPLRAVNCGALAQPVLMSTLFGHERGAFTSAAEQRPGLFEAASGGTLFLDEVGELSPEGQAALLRVLESRQVRRVGGTVDVPVDVRLVAATHRDLVAERERGGFREDLLFRLNTVTLEVPPLRERLADVPLLAERFLSDANIAHSRQVRGFSDAAMLALMGYRWPGNIRELRNVVLRSALFADGAVIEDTDLPEEVRGVVPSIDQSEPFELSFRDRIQRYEAKLMISALQRAEGNKTEAARLLRMPVRTFVHKFRAFGLTALRS